MPFPPPGAPQTLPALAAALAGGRTTSRELIEAALDRIADPAGEGARALRRVYADEARLAADAQDRLRRAGMVASPVAGIPVSIKDLFDVRGEPTPAGSRILAKAPPAAEDAAIVARLRRAGAVIIGRTNMTEFAFSGVGLNPHWGTPGNPWDRARIPGGSSSGAPVSVADGMADLAIGTDTGGSVRIPAALCGLVGFKPSRQRVPLEGCLPLSPSLDSIGPIARSTACCAIADAVMAGEAPVPPPAIPLNGLRVAVPQTLVLDSLDAPVAAGFVRALRILAEQGARIADLPLAEFADYPEINAKGGFAAVEAYAWHQDLLARGGADYDPRVRRRIERGREMSAAEYVALTRERAAFIARVAAATEGFDALLWPSVALIAPPIAAFADDPDFARLNALLLRNTAIVNFLDGCAVSLPVEAPGDAPVGLMLVGRNGEDRRLLGMALGFEAALSRALAP